MHLGSFVLKVLGFTALIYASNCYSAVLHVGPTFPYSTLSAAQIYCQTNDTIIIEDSIADSCVIVSKIFYLKGNSSTRVKYYGALILNQCSVSISNITFVGKTGASGTGSGCAYQSCPSPGRPGGNAFLANNSTISLFNCSLTGGTGGYTPPSQFRTTPMGQCMPCSFGGYASSGIGVTLLNHSIAETLSVTISSDSVDNTSSYRSISTIIKKRDFEKNLLLIKVIIKHLAQEISCVYDA